PRIGTGGATGSNSDALPALAAPVALAKVRRQNRHREPAMTSLPTSQDSLHRPEDALLGELPTWDLDDLYPGRDSEELRVDLERARREAKAFEADYKGRLDELARNGGLA